MNQRPADWHPLTGGDPCPGDPTAWDSIIHHWKQRSIDITTIQTGLQKYQQIDGQGNRIRATETLATDGVTVLGKIINQFDTACKTVQDWQSALTDMQNRADKALADAQAAENERLEAQKRKAALEAEAAQDESPDPIIHLQIYGFFGQGGLVGTIAQAQKTIEEAQKVVEEIRTEYETTSGLVEASYTIQPLEPLLNAAAVQTLGVNRGVLQHLVGFNTTKLENAFKGAETDPARLQEVLLLLSVMTEEQIKDYFLSHQEDALFATNPIGGNNVQRAQAMNKWWNAENPTWGYKKLVVGSEDAQKAGIGLLTHTQRMTLIRYAPGFVGNSQGIPYTYRSTANHHLASILATYPEPVHPAGWDLSALHIHSGIKAAADQALSQYETLLEKDLVAQIITFEVQTEAPPHLLALKPTPYYYDVDRTKAEAKYSWQKWDDVKAAISIGDLDKADTVNYLVHGIATNSQKNLASHTKDALTLYNAEAKVYRAYGEKYEQATVAWLNYEAPRPAHEELSVWSNVLAMAGGRRLAQDLDTLNTLRGQENIRLNPVGYSYGTDTTFVALTEMETRADNAVLLGSSGLPQSLVEQVNAGEVKLAVEPQNIAYTWAAQDLVAPLGYANVLEKINPSEILGATELNSNGGYDSTGRYYQDTDGHSLRTYKKPDEQGYLNPGTSSAHQVSLWLTDHKDQVRNFLDYVDSSDYRTQTYNGIEQIIGIKEDRKDMSSPEDLARLKEYARRSGISWGQVQRPLPTPQP